MMCFYLHIVCVSNTIPFIILTARGILCAVCVYLVRPLIMISSTKHVPATFIIQHTHNYNNTPLMVQFVSIYKQVLFKNLLMALIIQHSTLHKK